MCLVRSGSQVHKYDIVYKILAKKNNVYESPYWKHLQTCWKLGHKAFADKKEQGCSSRVNHGFHVCTTLESALTVLKHIKLQYFNDELSYHIVECATEQEYFVGCGDFYDGLEFVTDEQAVYYALTPICEVF